jgi:hypothetical protein
LSDTQKYDKINKAKAAVNWGIVAPTKVLIVPGGQIKLTKEKSLRLQALVVPENSTSYDVTWSVVSGGEYVTLNTSTGLVTAGKNRGTATIKVTAVAKNGAGAVLTATCTVEVAVPVEKVEVSPKTLTFGPTDIGKTHDTVLAATVSPKEAVQTVSWSSSNNAVATVVGGRVTARGYGTTTITVASMDDPTKKATCVVTEREPVRVSGVKFTSGDPVILYSTGNLNRAVANYTVSPSGATNKDVTFSGINTLLVDTEFWSGGGGGMTFTGKSSG